MILEYDSNITSKPEYISIDIYENVVKIATGIESPNILKVQCSMGSSVGENYCSQIYRSKIFYKHENSINSNIISIIIKSIVFSEGTDFLKILRVVYKENKFYSDILPRMEKLLGKLRFGPRLYYSLSEPISTLFFEDLNAMDFKMASREEGLNEVHALLTLKRLANFHASSMVLCKENPSIKEDFATGMLGPEGLNDENGRLMHFFGSNAIGLLSLIEKWPDYQTIRKKIRKYVENLRENLILSQAPSSKDTFHVLNHGDLWVNNMLFKYDKISKQPVDILFVDFQLSVWGSPGIDLNYFFYTSLTLDLLKYKRMELLEYYHNELTTVLKSLNHAEMIPTLEQVKSEFQNRAGYGFFTSFGILPTISMNKEISGDSNLDNWADEEFSKRKVEEMFQSKRLEETLKYTLKEFDKLGIWN